MSPTYNAGPDGRVLDGEVLALAGEGGLVAAVTTEGIFLKRNGSPWKELETPGIVKPARVTCLEINGNEIAIGTDGEGLHLFSGSTWEVRTSRYDGLPDDGVLSIAYDRKGEGFDGTILWVGTRKGIAARRNGQWEVYRPEKSWLVSIAGQSATATGRVYLGPGFKLGRKGQDTELFRPPVTAIGIADNGIVLGNDDSRIAVINGDAMAIMHLRDGYTVNRLQVDGPVIWAGTDRGLLWGGLRDRASGKPWPTHQGYLGWSAYLFGSRDSHQFQYRWKLLGYNDAPVVDLESRGEDLWAAYRAKAVPRNFQREIGDKYDTRERLNQVSAIRFFPNVNEYIGRREQSRFETYGPSAGVRGDPTAVYVSPDNQRIWIGTTSGLWELKR
jgi:hypothetical protein